MVWLRNPNYRFFHDLEPTAPQVLSGALLFRLKLGDEETNEEAEIRKWMKAWAW